MLSIAVVFSGISLILSSCSKNGDSNDSASSETVSVTEYDFVILKDGVTKFQLVRSDTSESVNPEIECVRNFYNQVKEKTGFQFSIKTDWDQDDVSDYEIVIGKTTREETQEIDRSPLDEKDFLITLKDNRLFIIGGSAEGTGLAVEYFTEHFINGKGVISIPEGLDLLVRYEYPVSSVKLNGTELGEYRIVFSEGGNAMVKYAAEELRDYLHRATGLLLETVSDDEPETKHEILVGTTNREDGAALVDRTGLGEEGFVISVNESKLVISGGVNEKRGTLYGVYEFLEKYIGWRFFTADTEVIYPSDSISIQEGLVDRQVPQFEFRDSFWKCYFNADIAAKRRINFAENHGFMEKHGDGFVYAGFVHTLGDLSETGDGATATPCLSDENIYQTVLKNVKAKLGANPDAKIISISQNDVLDGYCKCAKCSAKDAQAGSHMGSLLSFVNRIARDIAEDYPNVMVDTLAYLYTLKAPSGIVPEDNVIIRFCPMNACRNHALDDPDCSDNVKFMEYLEGWTKITDNIYVWDYTFNHMYPNAPFPELDVYRNNIRMFAEKGVTGYFMQGNMYSNAGEFAELKAYLAAKLLWDPYMSEECYQNLITEFLTAYYGEGWEGIKEWMDFTQDVTSKYKSLHYDIYASFADYLQKGQLNKTEVWERIDDLWKKAENMAEDKLTVSHIQKEYASYLYIKLSYIYPEKYMFGSTKEKSAYLVEARKLVDYYRKYNLGLPSDADATKAPIQWGK